jgi:4-aminobutyrate aminotransferase
VAAVFVEPIQSDGGVLVGPDGFLAGLGDLTTRHGALLVVDEVKVGLGRTGHLFGHHAEGVRPDVVTLGKALGGGLPLSAVVGPASVLDEPAASALMTTVGNLLDAVRRKGERLRRGLADYAASGSRGAAHIGDVRGRGLALGVELVDPRTREAHPTFTAKAVFAGWQCGVVAYPVRGNVIEVTPPLTITDAEVDEAVRRLTAAIEAAADGQVSDQDIAPYSGW